MPEDFDFCKQTTEDSQAALRHLEPKGWQSPIGARDQSPNHSQVKSLHPPHDGGRCLSLALNWSPERNGSERNAVENMIPPPAQTVSG
eukprot:272584-Amphidinium_carterae.1